MSDNQQHLSAATVDGPDTPDEAPIEAALASQPSPAATVETSQFETTKAGVIDWKMEAERANRLLAQAERPKCRLCGLEDACICAHLPPSSSADTSEPIVWIAFSGTGYVRFWTSDPKRAEDEKRRGLDLRGFTLDELIALICRIPDEPQAVEVPFANMQFMGGDKSEYAVIRADDWQRFTAALAMSRPEQK